MKPGYWDEATQELARRDRTLKRLMRAAPDIHLKRRADPFTTLARAIVGQQISVKAAEAVWRRFVAVVAPRARVTYPRLEPARVLAQDDIALRGAGLSRSKVLYVRDLAGHFHSGHLDPRKWRRLSDDVLIEELTAVKGIGRWTAEMFLIFHELRADVWPADDLGLQKAVALHYNNGERLPLAEVRALGERWAPWRSVATWYLWRSLEPAAVAVKE